MRMLKLLKEVLGLAVSRRLSSHAGFEILEPKILCGLLPGNAVRDVAHENGARRRYGTLHNRSSAPAKFYYLSGRL